MKHSPRDINRVSAFWGPRKILFGYDAINGLGREVRALGGTRPLLVTDSGVVRAGIADIVLRPLQEEGFACAIWDDVVLEPPIRSIDRCVGIIRSEGYDLVIGLGGGSSLDTAKGAAVIAANSGSTAEYVGMDRIPCGGIPKILIPTTSGSGAEVTRAVAVTDEADNTKKAFFSDYNLAETVILDPSLTISLPTVLTAETGLDALTHALEAFVSKNATPFSDMLARQAIGLIRTYLHKAFIDGKNREARYHMSLAASLAGLAFAASGLGAVHGLAFPLETEIGINHARAVAIMLPHVMAYNLKGNPFKFAEIARIMGVETDSLSQDDAGSHSISVIESMLSLLGISSHLNDYGVTRQTVPSLMKSAMKQPRFFAHNPCEFSERVIEDLYLKALETT